jgi:hypothetical protein
MDSGVPQRKGDEPEKSGDEMDGGGANGELAGKTEEELGAPLHVFNKDE